MKEELLDFARGYTLSSELNRVAPDRAISPELAGVQLFEAPIMGVADANDPLFEEYTRPGVVGPQYRVPERWLAGARSVVSFFFPFREEVWRSNAGGRDPSPLWLHGRIEGQAFISRFIADAAQFLASQGFETVAPLHSPDFRVNDVAAGESFGSNWSERHAAFAAGLGTFGLSRGLITEKGMAGRFASLITAAPMEPDARLYTDVYEYCIRCGACARVCPTGAISLQEGKAHPPCAAYVRETGKRFAPRYGCGKCQCGVPCSDKIP